MSFKNDDDSGFGRQNLPVASHLPEDFDGIPKSGMEYLFTVRRDARRLPHITRVPNPYELPERLPPTSDRLPSAHPALPTPEWCALYETRFRNFRKNLAQPTTHVQRPVGNRKVMPDITQRDYWWAFLAGKPIDEWDPPKKAKKRFQRGMRAFGDEEDAPSAAPTKEQPALPPPIYKPVEPTPSLLMRIDHRMALHLLMYFTHWTNLHAQKQHRVTKTHARWVFGLLSRLDEQLSSDEMHLLRNLARAYIGVLKDSTRSGTAGEDDEMDTGCCWLIIATVVGVWGQRDLWTDARDKIIIS
ncbi:hypothetical protein C8F01DRAFT_979630 [Mycena amicta]|nr:hypothetical protein C8F01DRAFT_979630 [Mycena amicta]